MKIILFVNSAKTFFWHRKSLADLLHNQGHEVTVVCSKDGDTKEFEKLPYPVILVEMSRKGLNPFIELFLLLKLWIVFYRLSPDVCHNFTIKCVIYGSLAQRFSGKSKIVNSITGLGIVFVNGGILQKFIEILYRITFKFSKSIVIFQNADDQELFQLKKIISSGRSNLILGSGVDTEKFVLKKDKNFEVIKIVFASRLLRSKGVLDLLKASKRLQSEGVNHKLFIAGEFDSMNRDTLCEADFVPYRNLGHITFLGNVKRMDHLLSESHIACFPSYYREGVPKFLLEAASAGLAIITTDAPGCREVLKNNGILIQPRDSESLYLALKKLISEPERLSDFGLNSRKLAEDRFSEKKILTEITSLYK